MPWKRRGNRAYFYESRREGGRVVARYVGSGPVAECVAALVGERAEGRARSRAEAREAMRVLEVADGQFKNLAERALVGLAGFMESKGFHRPGRHAWVRRRGATVETSTTTGTTPAVRGSAPPAARSGGSGIEVGHLERTALATLVDRYIAVRGDEKHEEHLEWLMGEVRGLATRLAGDEAPAAVRTLAVAAAVCHVEWQLLTASAYTGSRSLAQAEHASRIADRAHKRFVRTVKALAEVRKVEPRFSGFTALMGRLTLGDPEG